MMTETKAIDSNVVSVWLTIGSFRRRE